MQEKAKAFAIRDIKRGITDTLWVNRLKEECPKLYEYAKERASSQ